MLAGAAATGLLSALEQGLGLTRAAPGTRLQQASALTQRSLLRTLLFLRVVGLRRPWDLRGYSGDGLALLTGRPQAYGYRTVARFLRELATAGGAETLTDALGQWTTQLWQPARPRVTGTPPPFYIDGHRKAVYSDALIPRGLVGRRGAVLGCRALVLLHDAAGHPLFVTTHRGDLHLTVGVPGFLARYEAHNPPLSGFVIDREGMAAEFLALLTQAGRQVVTLLRRDQYVDLSSFNDVGPFVPWRHDRHGRLIAEVAAARYRLNRPDHPGETLELSVALVRDLRPRRPTLPPHERNGDLEWEAVLRQGQTLPPLAPPPRLLPIVVTAPVVDPLALAAAYERRWPAQENSFKDFLLPLGLDTNHGFGKTPVVNSEHAKRRAAVEQHLAALQRGTAGAQQRAAQAQQTYARQATLTQRRLGSAYGLLNRHRVLRRARAAPPALAAEAQAQDRRALDQAATLEAQATRHWRRAERAWARQRRETAKARRYEQDGRRFQQYLDDLIAHERPMFEVDNAQDQIMSVCTVALTNLVMWVRDQYFPASYCQATWTSLAPFLRLPGRITASPTTVHVALRPFNDRALSRDLALLCARLATLRPRLPDGRTLVLSTATAHGPLLHEQIEGVA